MSSRGAMLGNQLSSDVIAFSGSSSVCALDALHTLIIGKNWLQFLCLSFCLQLGCVSARQMSPATI